MGDRLKGRVAVVTGAGRGLGRYGLTCNAICPLAKTRLQTRDIGVRAVASALSDGGMGVIYMGTQQTAERVVGGALQEDVDVLGISFHSPVYEETST